MDLLAEPTGTKLTQTEPRRARAIAAATVAVDMLSCKGVTAVITGSLSAGPFHEGSDIDFLVLECPRSLKYAIESHVEDALAGLRFDVIYLDEVSLPAHRESLLQKAVDVRHLR